MRSILKGFLIATSFFLTTSVFADGLSNVLKNASNTTQLILVIANNNSSPQATLQRFERRNPRASWQKVGDPFPVVIGQNGIAWDRHLSEQIRHNELLKREGDGRSPAGLFAIADVFAYNKLKTEMPFFVLQNDTVCVDDRASTHYNQILLHGKQQQKDWNSGEQMRDVDVYELGLVVQYNATQTPQQKISYSPTKQAGSCIFLHIWRNAKDGTAGCTAMPKENLQQLVAWLNPKRYPVLVQVSQSNLKKLQPLLDDYFNFTLLLRA